MRTLALFTTLGAMAAITLGLTSPAEAQEASADAVTIQDSVPNRGLIVSGAVVLGATYSVSTLVALTSDKRADRALWVPIAGPWIDLANRGGCEGGRRCDGETTNKVLLVANGVGQAVGALQIVGGFLFPAKRTVTKIGSVHVVPMGAGLAAVGTF